MKVCSVFRLNKSVLISLHIQKLLMWCCHASILLCWIHLYYFRCVISGKNLLTLADVKILAEVKLIQ